MSENTHVAVAKLRQEGVHEWQSEEGLTDATNIAAALDAQTEATLALVFEQRTANLIAMLEQLPTHQGREILHDKIIERLDLA